MKSLKHLLLGQPLKSSEEGSQQLTKFKALALLSSDALSSVAYGTEQIVGVLAVLSAAAIWYSLPIAACVLILLIALTLSYRQIIFAYPHGGGAYVVSRENLGVLAGLTAGGSLLIDYMLTVAVSVSAGAEAITSAIPQLYGHQVAISVFLILVLMAMNLRGMSESASFLMLPVYLFIFSISVMIIVGLYKIMTGQIPYSATAAVGTVVPGITWAIIFKAFSSGSSSLTGVEAISNAVPFFKKPKAKNAAGTLAIMATILGLFFAGITFLNYWYGLVPTPRLTVLSQVAAKTFGGQGVMYYITQISTAFILAVAANTGFSAFPILSYNLAKDKFMPHMYLDRGDRLGYSNGIITLASGAIILILIFNGNTARLIPLYAVGVFIPFTLSQTGMIVKWFKEKSKGWRSKAFVNFIGAFISFIILIILFVYRLNDIWPVFILLPIQIYVFYRTNDHYHKVAEQLRIDNTVADKSTSIHRYEGSTVIVLIGNITTVTRNSLAYANSIGDYVIAMHVSTDENRGKELEIQKEFKREFPDIRFVDIHTNYRSIIKPTKRFIDVVSKNAEKRNFSVTVLVPQFIPNKPWQAVLHNQNSIRIRTMLSQTENITVATYTYHLKK